MKEVVHRPNSLIQELYLSSDVDEVGGFGKKGWGKSWAVNHAVIPFVNYPTYSSVVFRRTSKDFADLWEKAKFHYAGFDCRIQEQTHTIVFPSGARRKFSHLQYVKDIFTHNGQEYQDIEFDELPQFPLMPYQFMFSCLRNGSEPGMTPKMRATGNFCGEGVYWVKARFYDQLRPTMVRDGKIIRGDIGWFKTGPNNRDLRAPKDIEKALFALCQEKDWRFIKSKDPALRDWLSREWYFGERSDNLDLMRNDPGYEARLEQLPAAMKKAYKDGLPQDESLPDQLFMTEWVDAALTGKNAYKPGPQAFGLDYAETGDNTIKVDGVGNQVFRITDYSYTPHPAMAKILVDYIRDNGIYQILGGLDTVGTGAGVFTAMQALDAVAASRCNPIRHHDSELTKQYEQNAVSVLFKHLQYQILWKLRVDLQFGRVDLSPLNTTEHFYEGVPELREELLAFRTRDKDGGIWISSSDDLRKAQWPDGTPCLGRSPDRVKALAIWNYVRDWTPEKAPMPDPGGNRREFNYERDGVVKEFTSPLI